MFMQGEACKAKRWRSLVARLRRRVGSKAVCADLSSPIGVLIYVDAAQGERKCRSNIAKYYPEIT